LFSLITGSLFLSLVAGLFLFSLDILGFFSLRVHVFHLGLFELFGFHILGFGRESGCSGGGRTLRRIYAWAIAALLDAGGFAREATQVVKLGAANDATAHYLDLVNARRIQQERALHADAVRGYAADGKVLIDAA